MKDSRLALCLFLFASFVLHPHSSHAHNGAVAIAVPIEGIVVDGDLSDWPEGVRRYEIARFGAGTPLGSAGDFKAEFRISYNAQENALYVAVERFDYFGSYRGNK